MREGANHDALDHALEILGHVVNRLPLAQVDLGWRQVDRKSAELLNAYIEGDPGAQGWLLKNQDQGFALQRLTIRCGVSLDLAGEDQQVENFRRREVLDR